MKKVNSKTTMLVHSKAKVELYTKYLAKYLNIISRAGYIDQINIYDLFCGPGIYENGGEGSPIQTLKVIKDYYLDFSNNNSAKIKLNISFNDKNLGKITELEKNVEGMFIPKICNITYSDKEYQDILSDVKAEIRNYKNEKGVVFIDPYGYKDIQFQDIKELLDGKKTELLLFLPMSHMYRFVEKAMSRKNKVVEQNESLSMFHVPTPKPKDMSSFENAYKPLKEFLESMFGQQVPNFKSVNNFIEEVTKKFEEKLIDVFVDSFILERDNKGSSFCLFFFSSHVFGFEKMLETKWELDTERGSGFQYQAQSSGLFTAMQTSSYPQKLEEYIKSDKRYNSDLYLFGLKNKHLPKHTNEILREWQKNKKLSVLQDNGEKVRAGSFYTYYKEYKNEPNKVYFRIS